MQTAAATSTPIAKAGAGGPSATFAAITARTSGATVASAESAAESATTGRTTTAPARRWRSRRVAAAEDGGHSAGSARTAIAAAKHATWIITTKTIEGTLLAWSIQPAAQASVHQECFVGIPGSFRRACVGGAGAVRNRSHCLTFSCLIQAEILKSSRILACGGRGL
jgi:hypothetical protein